MIFLGNPDSRHLETWRKLYRLRGYGVEQLCTIHRPQGEYPAERRIALGGKLSSYGLLGLSLRWRGRGELLHAHGASGYGLSALLSGHPYIVTIYGSELLAGHGRAYSALVRNVLKGARGITVTSSAARDRIGEIDTLLMAKVHCFHTGLDLARLAVIAAAQPAARVPGPTRLMCIRNCAPHYRIGEILAALKSIASDVPPFCVTVPLGNGDFAYFNQLRAEFSDPWVKYIDGMLPYEDFLTLMRDTDICINFPMSDQTSATLLEALYFDRVIVTNGLQAYAQLFAETEDSDRWRIIAGETELRGELAKAITLAFDGHHASGSWGREFVTAHYGLEAASLHLGQLLEGLS